MDIALRVNDLNKAYNHIKACKNLSINIKKGDFFFILGPSGCGKTTLLKIIAGLLEQGVRFGI